MSGVGGRVWGLFEACKEARLFTCKCASKHYVEVSTESSPDLHTYTYYVVLPLMICLLKLTSDYTSCHFHMSNPFYLALALD
jgi:hypothetical protein